MKRKVFIITFVVTLTLLVIGMILTIKLYLESQDRVKRIQSAGAVPTPSAQDVAAIVKKVSLHIVLPDEEPKLITVSNVDVLKNDQPFFAKAKNGDKLLVYKDKVVLYDPTIDRVIDIAQIKLATDTPTPVTPSQVIPSETPKISPKYKISLFNTTGSSSALSKVEKTLDKLTTVEIVNRKEGQKKTYPKTLVIDLKGDKKSFTTSLAGSLTASISATVPSEVGSTEGADVLVVIGEDQKEVGAP